jgi:hypothetical protein
MGGHLQPQNSPPTFDLHRSGSQNLSTNIAQASDITPPSEHVGLAGDDEIFSPSSEFLSFLDGNHSVAHNLRANSDSTQAVPYTQQHVQQRIFAGRTQLRRNPQSNYLLSPELPTPVPAFPFADSNDHSTVYPANIGSQQFALLQNQRVLLPEIVPTAARTYKISNTSAQHPPPRDVSQGQLSFGYPSSQPHCHCSTPYALPGYPGTGSYYAAGSHIAPISHYSNPGSPELREDIFSVLEIESDDSRPPKRRRGNKSSREAETRSAYTRVTLKPTTRAGKQPAKIHQARMKRSLSSHTYEPFRGYFNSWEAARDELFGVKWTPPYTSEIPRNNQEKIPFVTLVYNAMTDFSEFYDKQGAKGDNRMLRQKAYDSKYIEARAWEVVVSGRLFSFKCPNTKL